MRILATLFIGFAASAGAASPDSWQSPLPVGLAAKQFSSLPSARFTEVALPAQSQALAQLESRSFESVEPSHSPSPIPPGFSCPVGERAFLVRALQWNPTLSGYSLATFEGTLYVKHLSLGGSTRVRRAALVVCLSTPPQQVFVEAYAAQ